MNEMPSKYFFRQRMKNRVYDVVIAAVEDAAAKRGMRKKDIAEKLGIHPSQVTRWLSGPANWGADTISDLLYAVDAELEPATVTFAEREQRKSNRFHPLEHVLVAPEHLERSRNGHVAAVAQTSATALRAGHSIGDALEAANLAPLASPLGNGWTKSAAPIGQAPGSFGSMAHERSRSANPEVRYG